MRKLLFIAFLSVISTGIPAYAVDYVACREMLRTKNEFASKLSRINTALDLSPEIFKTLASQCDTSKDEEEIILLKDQQILYLRKKLKKEEELYKTQTTVLNHNGEKVELRLPYDEMSIIVENHQTVINKLRLDIANKTVKTLMKAIKICFDQRIDNYIYNKTREGDYWYKKVLRVKEDMRRANCPY